MSKKNKSIENKNATDNDSTTDSKERKTLNISLQKRNLDLLNSIIDTWEKDGLVVSNEACNCILFKYDFENNPFLQTVLSRINLIKNNIDSKDLYGNSYNDALNIALKNVLEIKINPTELVRLLEDDLYFKNTEEVNTVNTSNIDNTKDNKQSNYNSTKDNNNSNVNNNYNIHIDENKNNNNTNDKNTLNETNTNEKNINNTNNTKSNYNNYTDYNNNTNKCVTNKEISNSSSNALDKQTEEEIAVEKYTNEEYNREAKPLVWNIPKPLYDNPNSDLNEKLNAFSYNI